MKKILFLLIIVFFNSPLVYAFTFDDGAKPLTSEKAFKTDAILLDNYIVIDFTIQPHYYIYKNKIKIYINNKEIHPKLPLAFIKNDKHFGKVKVYPFDFTFKINVAQFKKPYKITLKFQGCAEEFHLCYVPRTDKFLLKY